MPSLSRALLALLLVSAPLAALPSAARIGSAPESAAFQSDAPTEGTPDPETGVAGFASTVDEWMGQINGQMVKYIFYPIPLPGTSETVRDRLKPVEYAAWTNGEGEYEALADVRIEPDTERLLDAMSGEPLGKSIPAAVLILVLGALFFTIRMGLPQFRAFGHAIAVVRGKYDNPDDEGEVTSFQALTSALSATVGLGNIGGVAIAIGTGGPGATFWMIVAGFIGMAAKFTECTLGQMYRETRPDGRVMGGAMFYLSRGLKEMGLGPVGKVLAAVFAVVCIGASFGGGNTFQVNQSLEAIKLTVPALAGFEWLYGVIMATLVAVVILGGIQRIAQIAEKIVPTMCGIYVLACIAILVMRAGEVPAAFVSIFSDAFTPRAGLGGFLGVLVVGFKRAAFSNEAGIGSAAIAHSAARVPHPAREGIVALLEPFIDTIVVCTMTALVIVVTGAWENPEYAQLVSADKGAALTSKAFAEVLPFFPYILSVAVGLFAYSTMISWSYYGERCWAYLFGDRSSIVYRVLFVLFVFLGSIVTSTNVLNFGDLLIFGLVLPNVVGVVLLSGRVRAMYNDYMERLRNGEYQTYK